MNYLVKDNDNGFEYWTPDGNLTERTCGELPEYFKKLRLIDDSDRNVKVVDKFNLNLTVKSISSTQRNFKSRYEPFAWFSVLLETRGEFQPVIEKIKRRVLRSSNSLVLYATQRGNIGTARVYKGVVPSMDSVIGICRIGYYNYVGIGIGTGAEVFTDKKTINQCKELYGFTTKR